jgi:membrane-associated protease RseP (regulator of RpoE activity)
MSPPTIMGPSNAADFRMKTAGLLGVGILAQFVVTVDYQSGRAYFEPVPGRTLPTVLHGTGIIFDKPDHESFEVLDVLKGSAAERAGLHRGDRIVELAGRPARDLSISDAQQLNGSPGHGPLTVRTFDQRRLDIAIGQILP